MAILQNFRFWSCWHDNCFTYMYMLVTCCGITNHENVHYCHTHHHKTLQNLMLVILFRASVEHCVWTSHRTTILKNKYDHFPHLLHWWPTDCTAVLTVGNDWRFCLQQCLVSTLAENIKHCVTNQHICHQSRSWLLFTGEQEQTEWGPEDPTAGLPPVWAESPHLVSWELVLAVAPQSPCKSRLKALAMSTLSTAKSYPIQYNAAQEVVDNVFSRLLPTSKVVRSLQL